MADTLIWLVPLAVLVAGLRDARLGLVVFAATLPLFGSPPGGPYLRPLDAAGLLAIATAWRSGRAPRSELDWPVLAFLAATVASLVPLAYLPPAWQPGVLWNLLASLSDVERWTPLYTWRALADTTIGVGLFFAVRRAFAGRPLRPLFLALAGGLAATLLLGLAAHLGGIDLGFYRVKGGPNWEGRLHSLFFHSGWLAEYIVLATPPAVTALLSWRGKGQVAAAVVAGLAAPTVFLTAQRGAWFTASGQLLMATALWGRSVLMSRVGRRAVLLIAGLAVAAAAAMFQAGALDSALDRTRYAFKLRGRLPVWLVTLELAGERPLLGWGAGSFSPLYQGRVGPPAEGKFDWLTPHNHYLALASERGWLGLITFGVVVWVVARCLVARRSDRAPEERQLARGLLLTMAGFLGYGVVQYLFFLRMVEWLFWMLVGAAAVLATRPPRRLVDRIGQSLLVVALVAIPVRALVLEPLEAPGNRTLGFHRPEVSGEHSFQWMSGYSAFRLPLERETFPIRFANGHPRPDRHRVAVSVRVEGREVLRSEVPGEWRQYEIELGPPRSGSVLVEIEASRTFRPFRDSRRDPELEQSVDIRQLGLAVSPPPITLAPR